MATHWKKLHNPDYIGAYALEEGKDLIVTIKSVGIEKVKNERGTEECVVAHFVEKGVKPMILNSTNSKIIQKIHKTPYIEQWAGKQIQLYIANIKAFGEVVEALRIREYVPKPQKKVEVSTTCKDCGAEIQRINSMPAERVAEYTFGKYGRELCETCATKENDKGAAN